jgi:RNA polymerase sigma-70 factor (ECF subfamily)
VDENDWLAQRFETHRSHLRGVAYRMLGSASEADDAVQEAWLRLSRAEHGAVENLGGWLTTVVGRVCLDMLRSRGSRREQPIDEYERALAATRDEQANPEHEALLADSVGLAMLVVLDTLKPAERLAFVLHDMFAVPFDEIATILSRSPDATKMLASRARRRVRQASAEPVPDVARQREVVNAFLAASRNGDFDALLAVLDPDVVMRADDAVVEAAAARADRGAPQFTAEVRGPSAVAKAFSGRARRAQLALIDGAVGLAWAPGGHTQVVFALTIKDSKISAIDMIGDREHVAQIDVALLD